MVKSFGVFEGQISLIAKVEDSPRASAIVFKGWPELLALSFGQGLLLLHVDLFSVAGL